MQFVQLFLIVRVEVMTPKRLHIGVRTRTMYVRPNLRSELPPLDSHQGLGLPRASERTWSLGHSCQRRPLMYRQMLWETEQQALLEIWLEASIVSAFCNLALGRGLGVEATFCGNSGTKGV